MKQSIWKYQLETVDSQTLLMPRGASILTVQTQNEIPCLWALVDPYESKEERVIEIFGTGHKVNDENGIRYIGSYQLMSGAFVGHVFERLN